MIAIIDYDAGNIKSVEKALQFLGYETVLTRDPKTIMEADRAILPGVGAFGDAMNRLREYGLVEVIRDFAASNKPFLGICLGEQLLFEQSSESPGVEGLGICKGEVIRFPEDTPDKIPQIGWNSLSIRPGAKLFREIRNDAYVYFVHSYYVKAEDPSIVAATASYAGVDVHASVEQGRIFGCQFHPEKSGDVGLKILQNFATL